MSDTARLVVAAQNGDEQAFAALYSLYHKRSLAHARQLMDNAADAEDAEQEAWVYLWQHLAQASPTAFQGYLRRIVFGHCGRYTRGKHLPEASEDTLDTVPADALNPRASCAVDEMGEYVRGIVARLPPRQQEAVRLYHIGDLTERETCTQMNISRDSLRRHLRLACDSMRHTMEFGGAQ